jgi:copper transport protein
LPLVTALAVCLLTVLGWSSPAQAHARLETTRPAAGEQLVAAPDRIELAFDDDVEVGLGGITLTTGDGTPVDIGPTVRTPGDPTAVQADLPDLGDGLYLVVWRVVSVDGHTVEGAFTFRVGEGSGSVDREVVAGLLGDGGSGVVGALTGAARFASYVGLALVLGGAGFLLRWWPAGASVPSVRRLLGGGAVVAVVATLAGIGLLGADGARSGLGTAFEPSTWSAVLGTRSGGWWGWRALALAVLAAVVTAMLRRLRRTGLGGRGEAVALTASGLAAVVTVAMAGHAATGPHRVVGVLAAVVHLGAMAAWLGGLAVLALALAAAEDHDLRRSVTAFSRMAAASVAALVVTGLVQAWRQVGSWDALTGTAYGELLRWKVAGVVLMVAAAAASRRWVRQAARSTQGAGTAPGAGRRRVPQAVGAAPARPVPTRRQLRRSVLTEVAFGALVLAVTAGLVDTVPARAALTTPFSTSIVQGERLLGVSVTPGRTGTNEVHLLLSSTSGSLLGRSEATARIRLPEAGIPNLPITLETVAPGHWVGMAVDFPEPGTWDLEVLITVAEGQQVRFATKVPVR